MGCLLLWTKSLIRAVLRLYWHTAFRIIETPCICVHCIDVVFELCVMEKKEKKKKKEGKKEDEQN